MKVQTELTKLYYTIGEVAQMFGVSNSLIRYWESEFPMLNPQKNRKGDRRFTVKDIEKLERIYTLVKERGFTLEGAKKEMKRRKKTKEEIVTDVKERLVELRNKLTDLHDRL